ncbi:voltage-gated potassium channel [Azotobacter beijerinckii]|uniref:Voltage-gated potassium channel n=1 Tax=Azotobacter beijerinckii TaxID=170623 RepID=A0A1H9KZB2_9GAMM|nr:ion transporter [Azotobacter beijerinckii]SER04480.1 voltage-gated potassium channel [Azotobacter beijerinckii]
MGKKSWRERLYPVVFFSDTPAGRQFDIALLLAIFASLVVVMLDSVPGYDRYGELLYALEWGFTMLFAAEYLLRIAIHPRPSHYIFSFYGVVDLLAVLPAVLALLLPEAQYLLIIRVMRMLRVFRVLKLLPYLSQANFLLVALRGSRQKIIVFLFSVTTLMIVFGTLMYVIEGSEHGFTSIPASIYWAVVTMTTVGYGDMTPKTPLGQALATLVMITGYSVIAVPTGIFTAELASAMQSERLQRICPTCEKSAHEPDAAYCSRCGNALFPRHPESAAGEAPRG